MMTAVRENEAAYGARESEVKHLIKYTEDNEPVVIVTDDILKGVPESDWVKTVKDNLKKKFSKGIPFIGELFKVNKITRNEYTYSKDSQRLKGTYYYKDKMTASNNLDEMVFASTNYINEEINHTRRDNISEFARGTVNFLIGNRGYNAQIIVGITSSNELLLYDIINLTPKKIIIKKNTPTVAVHNNSGSNSSYGVLYNQSIPQSSPKSNTNSEIQGKKSKNDAFYFDDVESLKERQNSIVQQNNSMHDDYHTGIRGVEDIYTFEEALGNGEYEEGEDFSPDYTWQTAQRAVSSGKITIYSSYPIKQGVFVTPSKRKRKLLREK